MIARYRFLSLLALATAFMLAIHMLLLGGAAPTIRRLGIALPGWPAGAPAMRLALISDPHVADIGDTPARLRATVATINAQHPDLVLIAGDMLSNHSIGAHGYDPTVSLAPFAALRPRLGTIAVLGNHDYIQLDAIQAALDRLHIRRLDNQAIRIGPLAILGVSDAFSRHAKVGRTIASWRAIGGVPLMLTHSPDSIPGLPADVTLALAGHTHCGQVRLPWIGALTIPSRYGARYGCGVVREGARTSIVTAGLGMSGLPIRLGAAPDLWILTVGP